MDGGWREGAWRWGKAASAKHRRSDKAMTFALPSDWTISTDLGFHLSNTVTLLHTKFCSPLPHLGLRVLDTVRRDAQLSQCARPKRRNSLEKSGTGLSRSQLPKRMPTHSSSYLRGKHSKIDSAGRMRTGWGVYLIRSKPISGKSTFKRRKARGETLRATHPG